MRTASFFYTALIAILLPALAGCNMPGAGAEAETPDITLAYQTVQARLTQAATLTVAAPTPTVAASITPQPSSTSPILTSAPTATQAAPQPTAAAKLCDQAGAGVPIDVTIPDDTAMSPGQTFTKTWRLVNTGTCTWSTDYSIAVFSGESMSANNGEQLPNSVAPGQSVDISVDLVAPATAGTYQGNWKLRNASGQWFGIGPNGNSPFWVKIVVAGTPAATSTGTTSVTPTVTNTPSTPYPGENPEVVVQGSNSMALDDGIDLDSNSVNSGGTDLIYEVRNNRPMLSPSGSALFAVYGNNAPDYYACASSGLNSGRLRLENLSAGVYLCYRTGEGLFGAMRLISLEQDQTLTFQMVTWSTP